MCVVVYVLWCMCVVLYIGCVVCMLCYMYFVLYLCCVVLCCAAYVFVRLFVRVFTRALECVNAFTRVCVRAYVPRSPSRSLLT